MNRRYLAGTLAAFAALAAPMGATSARSGDGKAAFAPYLQCVPYARQVTGVQIYGDAHTWWGQAEGRYAKGRQPKPGAVMAFRPGGGSQLGHVAAVSRIIDSRTVLISHANWSPINGRRGQIEKNVRAIDVSSNNDWSKVRVWYAPIKALGGREWPISGFIYNEKPGARRAATPAQTPKQALTAGKAAPPKSAAPAVRRSIAEWANIDNRAEKVRAAPKAAPAQRSAGRNDPIGQIIARR